jgi:hypothetical protein
MIYLEFGSPGMGCRFGCAGLSYAETLAHFAENVAILVTRFTDVGAEPGVSSLGALVPISLLLITTGVRAEY